MNTVHRPVMLAECMAALAIKPGQTVVDGTAGGGGHTRKIAAAAGPAGTVIAIDRDPTMLKRAEQTLADATNVSLQNASYADLRTVLDEYSISAVDAILVDLGLSSDQLADRERGFGFQAGGPLDLRFDASRGKAAADWLKQASDQQIIEALRDFGDIAAHSPVTQAILQHRRQIQTTEQLVAVIAKAASERGKMHPATVVLQSLRIAVNRELEHVRTAMEEVFPACLKPGGRLAVLTFHSAEDRIVKKALQHKEIWTCRQKKPILPRPAEVRDNPRSRSAKLRVAVRSGT